MNILDLSFNSDFSDSESDGMSISDISLNNLHDSISDLKETHDISFNQLCKSIKDIKNIDDLKKNNNKNLNDLNIQDEWIEINLPVIDKFEIINNK